MKCGADLPHGAAPWTGVSISTTTSADGALSSLRRSPMFTFYEKEKELLHISFQIQK